MHGDLSAWNILLTSKGTKELGPDDSADARGFIAKVGSVEGPDDSAEARGFIAKVGSSVE